MTHSVNPRLQRGLAVAAGLVAGGLLSWCYRQVHASPFGYSGHSFWGWPAYEAALVCAGMGLAGLWGSEWRRAALSLALGGIATELVPDVWRELNAPFHDTVPPMFFAVVLFEVPVLAAMNLPAALAGAAVGRRVSGTKAASVLSAALLIAASGLALSLPIVDGRIRHRLETEELPALLRRIHQAEMSYSASISTKAFTCQPPQLPAVGNLGWLVPRRSDYPPGVSMPERASVWMTHRYQVLLDCGELGLWFDASVMRMGGPALFLYIDDTGELLVNPHAEAVYRNRIETREIPALLRRVHEAELSYRTAQPDKTFTCDGAQLPGLGAVRWAPKDVLHVDASEVKLDCQGQGRPRSIRITGEYGTPAIVSMSIDETGTISRIAAPR